MLTSTATVTAGGSGGVGGAAPVLLRLGGDVQTAAEVAAKSKTSSAAAPVVSYPGDGGFPSSAPGGTPATMAWSPRLGL